MKKSILSVFIVTALASGANAADLYQPDVVQAPPVAAPEVVVSQASGWYLRGDASFDHLKMRGAHYNAGGSDKNFDTTALSNGYNIGAGIGYQVNNYLRLDGTVDYFSSNFTGSTSAVNCTEIGAAACSSVDLATLSMLSVMANAYVDIGTYSGFTPYVGAGLGITRVAWGDLNNTACDTTNTANCYYGRHGGKTSYRFTWALMAGASYDINCNLKADVGYRYRHVNGGDMFGVLSGGGPGWDKGMDIHEGRIGLRYSFGDNGCGQVVYVPPAEYPQPVYK